MTHAELAYPAVTSAPALRRRLRGSTILFAVSIVLLLYFVAFPILGMIWESLRTPEGYSFGNYIGFFTSGAMLHAAFNTVLVALFTGVGSVLLATSLAFGVARTQMRCKQLLRLAVIISFASPPFLMTLAYIFIAGPNVGYANILIREIFGLATDRGPLDIFSLPGFIVLALPNTVAFVFIIMLPAFANMDAAMEEASRIAGAGKFRTVWHITLAHHARGDAGGRPACLQHRVGDVRHSPDAGDRGSHRRHAPVDCRAFEFLRGIDHCRRLRSDVDDGALPLPPEHRGGDALSDHHG
jgi:iron(III) transport system permease protein